VSIIANSVRVTNASGWDVSRQLVRRPATQAFDEVEAGSRNGRPPVGMDAVPTGGRRTPAWQGGSASKPERASHPRRHGIPVPGGVPRIGALNVGIGMCAYEPPRTPGRIKLVIPPPTPVGHPEGTLGLAEIPAPVMRGFAVAYPRHIPTLATLLPTAGGPADHERGSVGRLGLERGVDRPFQVDR